WAGQAAPEHLGRRRVTAVVRAHDAGQRVRLRTVPVRVRGRADRANVVEERVRVPDAGVEPELVADVGAGIAPVRDLDLVEDVVGELVEVRSAVGQFERE